MKIGDRKRFTFGEFVVKNEINTTNFKYIEQTGVIKCPHCNNNIIRNKEYNIVKIYIMENDDETTYIGVSDKGHSLKLPKEKLNDIGVF